MIARFCLGALAALTLYTPAAIAMDGAPPGVRVETADNLGAVFADPRGRTLYTWNVDKVGASKCNADRYHRITGAGEVTYYLPDYQTRTVCQEVWPPFAASADSVAVGDWSIIARTDQSRQWAYKGKALYTFVADSRPGEVNGVGPGRYIAGRNPLSAPLGAPPGVTARPTAKGRVLMTSTGKALYSGADRAAADGWAPLPAAALSKAQGDWTIRQGAEGGQWVFKGKSLYTYAGDRRFGDLNGAAEPGWSLASLQPPVRPPAEVTVQVSASGPIFTDRDGRTLYVWNCVDEAPDRGVCDIPASSGVANWRSICGPAQTCAANWRPLAAPKGAKPVGTTWSIVTVDGTGDRQYADADQPGAVRAWAFRGRPVYTYAGDAAPGDVHGTSARASVYWGFKRIPAGDAGNERF